jgi:hypothetical protein
MTCILLKDWAYSLLLDEDIGIFKFMNATLARNEYAPAKSTFCELLTSLAANDIQYIQNDVVDVKVRNQI